MTTVPCWARVRGPLAPYAVAFRVELERLGYTPLTAAGHLRLVAHLSRWMLERHLDPSALTQTTVDAYFAERRALGYVNSVTGRSLRPLLDYLRRLGVAPPVTPAAPTTPVEVLLVQYRDYLSVERGLAATTVELNVRLVRPFLLGLARTEGRLDLGGLDAGEVTAFVLEQSRQRPGSAGRIVTALRSLLSFLHIGGMIEKPLSTAVLAVPGWTQTGLPKGLPDEQVTALLASCDRGSATGCRDFAILTLLVRLGLRAGEVAALDLSDIHWRHGEITVRGKGNRCDRLPLPADVGEVIVDYLRDGRPERAQDRTVFVRAQAPYRALTSNGVTTVVVIAGRRAGLGLIGAHRLRHSAATAMLGAGGSLTEIGQVLRHQRLLTTAIYAKVDYGTLRQLVRPWPGDVA
ncbi:site-specific integrase [Streptomyces sp. NBC_01750]|uniref:site-specific integrase n=1 Tax=Streptomyces sp. NBC_01750 TaxID=2975928 RepID=UPI002DD88C81|nr:site-specific integrase [Streptomyces sp. NBC_01750]WSD37500.1 site-specific integrase [Streptomyces sp. NBC_01750]